MQLSYYPPGKLSDFIKRVLIVELTSVYYERVNTEVAHLDPERHWPTQGKWRPRRERGVSTANRAVIPGGKRAPEDFLKGRGSLQRCSAEHTLFSEFLCDG